jgi:hypothetical protein
MKKKNGSLCMCVNYCDFNKVTINNHCLLPLILRLFKQLSQTKIFIKFDLKGAYNLAHIKEVMNGK